MKEPHRRRIVIETTQGRYMAEPLWLWSAGPFGCYKFACGTVVAMRVGHDYYIVT